MPNGFQYSWILVAYLAGALPLSLWLGQVALGVDIRTIGDGNPGASNVWRAGGTGWGLLAVLLDFSKGAIPVAVANFGFGWDGWALVAVALAPILGHAFSPFLGLRGGKALAVSFGVWMGLSLWLVPMLLGAFFALGLLIFKEEVWAVLAGSLALLVALLFIHADWTWFAVWAGMTAIFIWTHRRELRQPPSLKRR